MGAVENTNSTDSMNWTDIQIYKNLFEHHPEPVYILDRTGTYIWMNEATVAHTGYSIEECIEHKFVQSLLPEDYANSVARFRRALQGEAQSFEVRYRNKAGQLRVSHTTHTPVQVGGEIVCVLCVSRDITERKQGEWQLLASEERYRMITEHSLDLISIHDFTSNYVFVSPACRTLLGYEPEEMIGKAGFAFVHPDDAPNMELNLISCIERNHLYTMVYRKRHKNGTYIWFETIGKILQGDESSAPRIICISRDITMRMELDEERKKTEQLLLQSEKLSIAGQLAAGIAHEIRNPLTAIKGFLQLMKRDVPVTNAKYVDIMFAEMDRIEMILGELLVLAKPQVNTYVLHDLRAVLLDVVTLINPQALMTNIEIKTRFDERFLMISCDSNQLKQVFINFLKNAIEAMPDGGTITVQAELDEEKRVRVQFIDEGCGIPKERLVRLCEPFYTTKEKGTGLGLMVSKKIIENHHGTMEFTSEVGVGTTVHLYLPLSEPIYES